MKSKLFVAIASIALFAVSCSSEEASNDASQGDAKVITEKGDPCDCVDSKIEATQAFMKLAKKGEFRTTKDLNIAFAQVMDGCMKPTGNKELDYQWSVDIKQCEQFSNIRAVMIEVQTIALELRNAEKSKFNEGETATKVLDKLKEGK